MSWRREGSRGCCELLQPAGSVRMGRYGWVGTDGCEPPTHHLSPANPGLSAGGAPCISVSHSQPTAFLTGTGPSLPEFLAQGIPLF